MVKLIMKDLNLAIQAAESVGASCEETKRAYATYEKLHKLGYSDKDFSFIYQYIKH